MTKSKIFLVLSLSFIFGIFFRSFFNFGYWHYFFAIAAVISLTVFYKNKIILISGFAILCFVFGIWLTDRKLAEIQNINQKENKFSGTALIVKEPEIKDDYQKITAEFGHSMFKNIKILINAGKYPEYFYGDEIKINCNLEVPKNYEDGFDYRMYLAKDKIYYLCQKAQIEKTGNNYGSKIYIAILKLKNKMEENINQVVPYPESALANGLIFGGSSDLPKNLKDNFSRTGMTHIVAVSGYNVTIIAEYLILFGIFIGLWRKQAFWFALFGIILFVVMIGLPSSAVRAGVMGSLLLWAMKNGRLANSWNAIIFAGAVMLLINPLLLRWDIGFQLSFLATLGIIALAPFWEKFLIKRHKAFGFTEIFFLTLSAQIFVLPIILYNFHTLSLVSLAANLLILLIIPISMLLVFLAAVAGLIFTPLSLSFAWLAYLPLKYEVWVVDTLGRLEWASKTITEFNWHWIILWYLLLSGIVVLLKRKNKSSKLNAAA